MFSRAIYLCLTFGINFFVVCLPTLNVPPSPCPDIFSYEFKDNEWYGRLTIHYMGFTTGNQLKIVLSIADVLSNNYLGKLEVSSSKQQILNHFLHKKPLRYKLSFPTQVHLPRLLNVSVNDRAICWAVQNFPLPLETIITLEHTLQTNFDKLTSLSENDDDDDNTKEYEDENMIDQSDDDYKEVLLTKKGSYDDYDDKIEKFKQKRVKLQPKFKPIITTTTTVDDEVQKECGRYEPNKKLTRGGFPWTVAIYKKDKFNLMFRCSGVLITKKHILSAAHCFYDNDSPIKANELILSLGKYDLSEWQEHGSLTVTPKSINIHPRYTKSGNGLYADVAIVNLKFDLVFSAHVKPACLWKFGNEEGDDNVMTIWNEDLQVEKIPMPIVTQEECLRSKIDFFYMTSNLTFCAGLRNGRGPCSGDSGSGIYTFRNNRWYVRGIISMALLDLDTNKCNRNEFSIFTDVGKVSRWIGKVLSA